MNDKQLTLINSESFWLQLFIWKVLIKMDIEVRKYFQLKNRIQVQ